MGLFAAEGALQYRYAKKIAALEEIPPIDHNLQAPEGIHVFQELTLGADYLAGYSFRLARLAGATIPFHKFIICLIASFSSLTVFAIYGLSLQAWNDKPLAAGSALLFAAIPAGLGRTVGNYALEDFSTPLAFLGVLFFLKAWQKPSQVSLSLLAGALLAAALATWHFAKFFLTVFTLGLAAAHVFWASDARLKTPLRVLGAVLAGCGALAPVLRSQYFVFSAPMLTLYVLILMTSPGLASRLSKRKGLSTLFFCAACLVLLVLTHPIQRLITADYAHVSSLFYAKLRYLLVKPDNPSLLSMDARMIWAGDSNSPDARFILYQISSLAAFAALVLPVIFLRWKNATLSAEQKFVVLLCAAFLIGTLLVRRLFIFGVPLLCTTLGSLAILRPDLKRWLLGALFTAAPLEVAGIFRYSQSAPREWDFRAQTAEEASSVGVRFGTREDYLELLSWIQRKTDNNSTFLTDIALSAEIVAYTGRKSNLHPKFETKRARDKTYRFIHTVFNGEEALASLCAEWETDYLVYQPSWALDRSKESLRYMAGIPALSSASTVFQFHFDPERLRRFSLIYENPGYRVFRFDRPGLVRADTTRRKFPLYDLSRYQNAVTHDGLFDDSSARAVLEDMRRAFYLEQEALQLYSAGKYEETRKRYAQIFRNGYATATGWEMLGQVFLKINDPASAADCFDNALKLNPERARIYRYLAYVRLMQSRPKEARASLLRAIEIDPANETTINRELAQFMRISTGDPPSRHPSPPRIS